MEVIVVGGGIAGLAASYRLLRAGVRVTLLESTGQLGGLGTFFRRGDRFIDRFYHCTMPTDQVLLALVQQLGLHDQYIWRETTMGMIVQGAHYNFSTPLDLLRYKPLSVLQRLWLGAGALCMRHLGQKTDLNRISAEAWLTSIYGKTLWQQVWFPLLRAKFGDRAGSVPARYIWQRAGREGNKSRRGYPACGYYGLIAALQNAIVSMGGRIYFGEPVRRIRECGTCMLVDTETDCQVTERKADAVISTLPLPLLKPMLDGHLCRDLQLPNLNYQGVVNALFFMQRGLKGHYWTPVIDDVTGFDGVVEMSTLVDRTHFGGLHLAYTMRYTHRDDALFCTPSDQIAANWTRQLLRLYPELRSADIVEVLIFKAPYVEPIWPLNYTAPSIRVKHHRLFLASAAQVYPQVTSWNASVGLANTAADALLEALE